MEYLLDYIYSCWHLLEQSAAYILFGLFISGLLNAMVSPALVARHLGRGRFASVFKSALLGVPIPLCSCGVLPTALSLKKQGANNGATVAFMISTPESGVDSIAVSYALLDPVLTVIRPIAAFFTAAVAGVAENLLAWRPGNGQRPDASARSDRILSDNKAAFSENVNRQPLWTKMSAGIRYAMTDFWADLAGWFFLGLLIAGAITTFVPDDALAGIVGTGWPSMLIMLVVGIPLYVCATASTPIAAALILKGVSPGAALVFLLVGPATNAATLTMVTGLLGKRAAAIYLAAISCCAIGMGILTDRIYGWLGVSAHAIVGQTGEILPAVVEIGAALVLVALSVKPIKVTAQAAMKCLQSKPATPAKATDPCGDT